MRKQVVVIHGGNTYDSYDEYLTNLKSTEINLERMQAKKWKESLHDRLGEGFEVIKPSMPNGENAKYIEWKIWFDKLVPLLQNNLILIGHSLGGIFIAKYLSENKFLKNISSTILLAAPFDDKDSDYSLADFELPKNLDLFSEQCQKISVYHSKDDPVVPFNDSLKYLKAIPRAQAVLFENKKHFNQPEFPELIENIKTLDN